jgi:hypothetical protein
LWVIPRRYQRSVVLSLLQSKFVTCSGTISEGEEMRQLWHAWSDPLGVSFSLGGTLVNVLFIYLLLPCLEKLLHQKGRVIHKEPINKTMNPLTV